MTENDFDEFAEGLGVLAEVLGETLSSARISAYFTALSDLSIAEADAAMRTAMQQAKFFPKPADLRELVQGTADDQASTAWDRVVKAYKKAGFWTSVYFEDGAIGVAVETVFGTWALCSEQIQTLSQEMLRAKQKEFVNAYRRAVRGVERKHYLPGYHESNNRNTTSRWQVGTGVEENGRRVFKQPVYVQGERGRLVEATYCFFSGELLTTARELLEGPTMRRLPPAQEARLLSAANEEPMEPEEAKALISESVSDLVSMFQMNPPSKPMTDEELLARRRLLEEQAKMMIQMDSNLGQ